MCTAKTAEGPLVRVFNGFLNTALFSLLLGLSSAQLMAAPYTQGSGPRGIVSIEAEDFDANVSRYGKSWTNSYPSGYTGTGALTASPNTGNNNNTGYATWSPRLDYAVNFVKTGVHYVWIRGVGATGNDDSLHVGLDGAELTSSNRISRLYSGIGWTNKRMGGSIATINVTTTGEHTLNVWMREDGTVIDKIVLVTDSSYTPTNAGPTVSVRGSTGSASYEPVATLSTNSLNFGTVDVGGISNPSSVTLTNSGTAPLYISGIYASTGFIQGNNCSDNVPAGGNCKIYIQFVPATSGDVTGALYVVGNMKGSSVSTTLRGTGSDSTQYNAPANNNFVLNVDFENRKANSPYTEAQVIEDFNANRKDGTIYTGNARIVRDPSYTGRGNVLRALHVAGEFGNAVNFKARFAPDNQYKNGSARFDDVFLAYDIYLSSNTERMPWHKLPGLGTGTKAEMAHATNVIPEPEGILAFTALMQSFTSASVQNRPDGALSVNYYDAQKTQNTDWLDTVDPTLKKGANSYVIPLGRWVTIEQRVKMNTADSNDAYNSSSDLKNGLAEVWIDGVKMSSKKHLWRWTTTMKADGFWFIDYYNHRPDLVDPPSQDQYVYYDNFRVSTTPITSR